MLIGTLVYIEIILLGSHIIYIGYPKPVPTPPLMSITIITLVLPYIYIFLSTAGHMSFKWLTVGVLHSALFPVLTLLSAIIPLYSRYMLYLTSIGNIYELSFTHYMPF